MASEGAAAGAAGPGITPVDISEGGMDIPKGAKHNRNKVCFEQVFTSTKGFIMTANHVLIAD